MVSNKNQTRRRSGPAAVGTPGIAITGVGVRCALGNSAPESLEAVLAGADGHRRVSTPSEQSPRYAAPLPGGAVQELQSRHPHVDPIAALASTRTSECREAQITCGFADAHWIGHRRRRPPRPANAITAPA